MFICDFCKGVSKSKEPLTLIPVEFREVAYINHKVDPETEETLEIVSRGKEIVEEKKACTKCAKVEVKA